MKKIVFSLFITLLLFSTISFAAYPADAEQVPDDSGLIEFNPTEEATDNTNNDLTIESTLEAEDGDSDVYEDDMYVMDNEANINQVINGNLYVMAKKVKITDASILGNAYILAQDIEIENSTINTSLFLVGENIKLTSTISNDLYAIGQNVNLAEDTNIWRTARIGADKLKVDAEIDRDLYATVGSLEVGDNTIIRGNLAYTAENEGNISEEAEIGSTNYTEEQKEEPVNIEEKVEPLLKIKDFCSFIFKSLIISIITLVLIKKFKELPRTEKIAGEMLKSCGKGFGVLCLTPIISVLLFITIIGIGLGFALIASYIIALYVATSLCATEIAYRIALNKNIQGNGKVIGISVLISILIWLIGCISILGGIVKFIVFLIGLGIIFDLIFKKIKKDEEKVIVNEN